MPRFFKSLAILFIAIIILAISTTLFISFLAQKSLPDYNRVVESSFIKQEIVVFRDDYAIPDIKGKEDEDVFFALGYVHAQDRLWQMLLLRRTAQGKLSEYFGTETLDTDIFMRTLDIYNKAHKSIGYVSPEILQLIKAYSNGVNQRLMDIRREGLGRGTPNLFLFPPKVAPWTPTDSIAILKLLALQNNESAQKEVIRLNLLKAGVSSKRLSDLFSGIPDISDSKTLSNLDMLSDLESSHDPDKTINKSLLFKNPLTNSDLGTANASNVWVSLPPRTASGSTLVGYNLHTKFEVPIIWMIAKLTYEKNTVIGATIPGIPAILTGRSKFISWGIASSNLDNQDLIIENINPNNPEEYLDTGEYKKFKKRTVLIKIRGKPGLTHTIRSTERGPIIPPKAYGLQTIVSTNQAVALKWTGLDPKDRSIESLILAMAAKDILAAKQAFKYLVVPSYNVLLADPKSAVIVSAGKIPNRIETLGDSFGVIPSLGWKNPMEWDGYLEFDKNPSISDTLNDTLFNTNNRLTKNDYPEHFSYDWEGSQRNLRMRNLFEKRQFHSLQSFKEIHSDIVSSSARTVLPLLAKNLWYSQTLTMDNDLISLRKKALELLGEWNGEMSIHLSQPLIYNSWVSQFQRMILQDELGSKMHWFKSIKPDFLERVLRNVDGAGIWCDIIQTQKIETCDELALMALDDALVTNVKLIRSDIAEWRWGDYHKARFKEKIIGGYPIISYFTNIVYETPGGDNTLSMARSLRSSSNIHDVRYGSTLRIIFDLSNPNYSFMSMPTGQSGHLFSRHYDDFSILWKKDEYHQIYLDDTKSKTNASSMMNFKPLN